MATNIVVPAAYFFVGLILVFCYNDVIASLVDVGEVHRNVCAHRFHSPRRQQRFRNRARRDAGTSGFGVSVSRSHLFRDVRSTWRGNISSCPCLWKETLPGLCGNNAYCVLPGVVRICSLAGHGSRFGLRGTLLKISAIARPLQRSKSHCSEAANCFSPHRTNCDRHRLLHPFPLHAYRASAHRAVVRPKMETNVGWCCSLYDVVLCAAILLLEQHFFMVDLIGGVIAAAAAIALVKVPKEEKRRIFCPYRDYGSPRLLATGSIAPAACFGFVPGSFFCSTSSR